MAGLWFGLCLQPEQNGGAKRQEGICQSARCQSEVAVPLSLVRSGPLDTGPAHGSLRRVANPSEVHRIRLRIQYDGSAFFGWQLQKDQPTVQGELETVLSRLFAGPVRVIGSGRTDRGVHAIGQVAAVDAPARWEPEALRRAVNALLPASIWVAAASAAEPRFHPRFDAVAREYVYRVGVAPQAGSPFYHRWCWPCPRPLDAERLGAAAAALPGDHSFAAFAKAGQEERGDRCSVHGARWCDWAQLGLEFHISANRFLHHMVRYLVGTMAAVGAGLRPVSDIERLLSGERGLATSPPAPPQGLFLTRVRYPGEPAALPAWDAASELP